MTTLNKFLFLMTVVAGAWAQAQQTSALDLLRASDRGRGAVQGGIVWSAKVETSEDGETSVREFFIQAKGDNALVEATAPARTKGEKFVFNDRAMWFFKPSLKKPVSISPRQKLSGQAANGGIASTHYARDYTPTVERREVFAGRNCVVLFLKAKSNQMTYDQIRYWIDEDSKLAIKAEFLTLQGKPFKVGLLDYENKIAVDGKTFPFISKLTISDAKFPKNKSVIIYREPKVKSLGDGLFNVNNLSR